MRKESIKLTDGMERILIALLNGPQKSHQLVEATELTPQHLSRLLQRLIRHNLVFSRYRKHGHLRESKLSSKGHAVAQTLLAKEQALQQTVSAQELQRAQLWIGEWEWRGW